MLRSALSALATAALFLAFPVSAQNDTLTGPFPADIDLNGSNFTYPWPIHVYKFESQFEQLEMAYMDVKPTCRTHDNSTKTIVMMHGKNFCSATWEDSARRLSAHGYRVILPDQIGFCKSSKPTSYQYSLEQLSLNINGLVKALGIKNHTVMGHSLGGMTTARYGLMFADEIDQLIMVDPVGLEDWVAKGVPYINMHKTFEREITSSYESIRGYEQATYYSGNWQSSYDEWVYMLLTVYNGPLATEFARVQARIVDMVLTQPIAHEFSNLKTKTLLMIGEEDHTAIGSQWSPPDVQAKLGHYDVLGPQVASEIPDCKLVAFPGLGHAPFFQEPELFHEKLFEWLL